MKKYLIFIFVFILFISIYSQNTYLGYNFNFATYYNYTEITGGNISTATGDDGFENITLPFPFKYMDTIYTNARISVNGWLEMGQTFTGLGYQNQLASTTQKPLICPLWDDLFDDNESEIRYETIGKFPVRIFVVQWKNIRWRGQSTARKNFQVRLWELDNAIEFAYGIGTNENVIFSYSIGLNNKIGGINNFISVYYDYNYGSYRASNKIANDTIRSITYIRNGIIFSFFPAPNTYSWGRHSILYQTPDTVFRGNQNQKILAIIISCHVGNVLTPPWITKFLFTTQGTTNTNDILNAKLFYTASSPDFSTQIQKGETVQNPTGNFSISIPSNNYLRNNGLVYYWLAYDISTIATIGNFVDGKCIDIEFASCCPNLIPDSAYANSKCIIMANSTPSIINIGSSGQYPNLTQAINYLKNTTISSPVILELLNTYQPTSETYPIYIPFINGCSQENTITIRPAENVNNIDYNYSDSSVIIFNSSKYITIDGRPGGVGNNGVISFKNSSYNNSTIKFLDSSFFNSIKYCKIYGSDTTINGGVVLIDSRGNNYNSGNSLINCLISKSLPDYPLNCIKFKSTYIYWSVNASINIMNCEIKDFIRAGIDIEQGSNCIIEGTKIYNSSNVPSYFLNGIINQGIRTTIKNCKIYSLNSSISSLNEIRGVNLIKADNAIVVNNFISLSGNEYSSLNGLYSTGDYYYGNSFFYYNTINIFGVNNSNAGSICFFRKFFNSSSKKWFFKNNILINNRTNQSGSANHLAVSIDDIDAIGELNYNNYYVHPSQNYLGVWNSSLVSNIQQWKNITNRDQNSISKSINFISNVDLHLTGNSLGDFDLIGSPISEITSDIDGELRNSQFPYIGADENTEYPLPVELSSLSAELIFNDVVLTWHSESEVNNFGFDIERVQCNNFFINVVKQESWEKIGFVKGNGTSSKKIFYTFKDNDLKHGIFKYRLVQIDLNGQKTIYNFNKLLEVNLPDKFELYQNYPNPFNPNSKIKYQISNRDFVTLKVYDVLGNEVATLVDGIKEAGNYEVEFNTVETRHPDKSEQVTSSLPSGVYFATLTTSNFTKTIKMVLIK